MTPAGIFRRRLSSGLLALMVVALMVIWSNRQLIASQSLPEMVAGTTPKGWQISGEVKQFTPENLYEQINGRASYFMAYDMIRMTYVSFVISDETAKFINLSIYDMGTPTNAFGVFSAERSQGDSPLDLGRASYRTDANYFVWKGQYYIQIISSEATDEFQRIGMDLSRLLPQRRLAVRFFLSAAYSKTTESTQPEEPIHRNEQPTMTYRKLGRTGFMSSRLVFGCGAALMDGKAVRLLQRAFEAGINHFDVGSDIYYKGSERYLAPFLKDHRDQVWVVSKAPAFVHAKSGDILKKISSPRRRLINIPFKGKAMKLLRHIGSVTFVIGLFAAVFAIWLDFTDLL
ncbi:MAG: DUF6599 family protein [Desulfobacterales bacterium]